MFMFIGAQDEIAVFAFQLSCEDGAVSHGAHVTKSGARVFRINWGLIHPVVSALALLAFQELHLGVQDMERVLRRKHTELANGARVKGRI